MFKDKRLNDVVFPEALCWTAAQSLWGRAERRVAGQQDIDALRNALRALAAALGYEWVPEGKTAARWQKRQTFASTATEFLSGRQWSWIHADEPPATPKRRKGDKKGGRK